MKCGWLSGCATPVLIVGWSFNFMQHVRSICGQLGLAVLYFPFGWLYRNRWNGQTLWNLFTTRTTNSSLVLNCFCFVFRSISSFYLPYAFYCVCIFCFNTVVSNCVYVRTPVTVSRLSLNICMLCLWVKNH